jgi:AcrR family transcriptional regulator
LEEVRMADADVRGRGDGRQARWDRHNQARRQHILDAAIAVLEASEAGGEAHVQQIAERAGLGRTVVYRHFADRADLDAAVQAEVLALLREELVPALSFEGTPVDIIRRIVATYVGWAARHPALHQFAQRDAPGPGPGQMERAVRQIAGQIEDLITVGVEVLHVRLDTDDVAALDPLVFGLVGAVFTSTRRWLARPERQPALEGFVELVTESVWLQIRGMAAARGVDIDPDVPVEQLLEAALEGAG